MELDYATEKIYENFSNYSAFHHRAVFLKDMVSKPLATGIFEDIVQSEFSLVENAVFTEPDDQSAWWYQQYLCTFIVNALPMMEDGSLTVPKDNWVIDLFLKQVTLFQNLLEIESDCRWAMKSIVFLVDLLLNFNFSHAHYFRHKFADKVEECLMLRQSFLNTLCEIDKPHLQRYLYLSGKKLM
jgi:hypothetical protein